MADNTIIIGAGVIGASLAYRLAQSGERVTLVERGGPGYGTTGSSFAWTNSNTKTPEDYFALNRAGMAAHRELRDELGSAPWLREGGNIEWAVADVAAAELEARVARLHDWEYQAEWLDRAAIAELEPGLHPEPEVEQAAYFPEEAMVDGPVLARTLAELAAGLGATLRFASEVAAIERSQDGGRVTGVQVANGERISGDIVVNCAGPAADRIARMAGRTLPLAPTLGFLVRASGAPDAVKRVVHGPRLHLRPDTNGLIMLHHDETDAAVSAGANAPEQARELLARAAEYVPAMAQARLSRWTVATRPIPADGRTSAGLLPSLPGYAEIVTHSGITLGPLLGRLLAQEIRTGQVDPLLAAFRPERFE